MNNELDNLLNELKNISRANPELLTDLKDDMYSHLNNEQSIEFLKSLLNYNSPYKNIEMTEL